MRLRFKVKLKGMEKAKKLSKEKARRVLMKSMFKMEELALQKAPVDKGDLKQKITLFPQILANHYELISPVEYSADLEYGNSPRVVKFSTIFKWVKRKKIATNDEHAAAFAMYVKKKIAREGVNPSPFLRPALYEVKETWLPSFAKEERKRK